MTLELWYWIALGVGVAFLLLSIVLGDIFDFLDFLDFDLGDGFSATPVFFTAVAAFGGGGLLGIGAFGLGTGGSVLTGLGLAVIAGGLATAFFILLHKQEAGEGFSISQLVGARGRVTLAIQPGKEGRVAVQHEGMTRNLTATSSEALGVGEDVIVRDTVSNSLKVERSTAGPGTAGATEHSSTES